jgi:2,4-dienoyl-CoA reductase-like NADH-dependent reductase (Old Yellow Enzyme family)
MSSRTLKFLFIFLLITQNFSRRKEHLSYKRIFYRTKIGNLEVKNHFIRTAADEGLATDKGEPTEKLNELYKELCQSTIGTLITSSARVENYEQSTKNQLGIYDDSLIPSFKTMIDTAHSYETKIIMQIKHGSSFNQIDASHAKILGPSAIKNPISGINSKEITKDEIKEIIELFSNAALRVKKAGFDGVIIHVAHDNLLSEFISPIFNHRQDEYGGSPENRIRIVREILKASKEKVGKDYPVWIKINSSDDMKGGLNIEDFLEMCKLLEKDGADAFEVSGMIWYGHKEEERLYYKEGAYKLSEIVNVPVILAGGIRDQNDIRNIIQNSYIQFFGLSRPFVTDKKYLLDFKEININYI